MGKRFSAGEMHLPERESLSGSTSNPLPSYLLDNEIFPLETWLMPLYPWEIKEGQSLDDYRHSNPRPVIEKTFGILVARWRIFNVPINASVENIGNYVKAVAVLHNYLRQTKSAAYCTFGKAA